MQICHAFVGRLLRQTSFVPHLFKRTTLLYSVFLRFNEDGDLIESLYMGVWNLYILSLVVSSVVSAPSESLTWCRFPGIALLPLLIYTSFLL